MTDTVQGAPAPADDAGDQRPDPPAHRRRTVLAAVAGFGVLGLVATVLGGDVLNPPATTTDGDYAGETVSRSFRWPRAVAPTPGPGSSARR